MVISLLILGALTCRMDYRNYNRRKLLIHGVGRDLGRLKLATTLQALIRTLRIIEVPLLSEISLRIFHLVNVQHHHGLCLRVGSL